MENKVKIEDYSKSIIEFDDNEERNRFEINNLESCNWAFRKLKALDNEDKETQELYEQEKQRIDKWRELQLKRNEDSRTFFQGLILEYYLKERANDDKFKINTPYGKVTTRKLQDKFVYDEKEFVKWAEETNNEEYLRIKKEINKADFKKVVTIQDGKAYITDTGEVVEGLKVESQGERVSIKVVED